MYSTLANHHIIWKTLKKLFLGFKYIIPGNEKTGGFKLPLQKLTVAPLGTSAYIPVYPAYIS